MALCPRFAAAGSPGTSSVSTKATNVMPRPSRKSAARRRARNLRKGRDGSRSRHPGLSSWLAADAADVDRPGGVVVGALHALGRHHHLPRLNEREKRSVSVQLVLDLLEELAARLVVSSRAGLGTQSFEARVGPGGPARPQAHQLTGQEHQVVVRVGIIRSPQPQPELLLAGA